MDKRGGRRECMKQGLLSTHTGYIVVGMMPEVRIGLIMNGLIIRQDRRISRIEISSFSLYMHLCCCEPCIVL